MLDILPSYVKYLDTHTSNLDNSSNGGNINGNNNIKSNQNKPEIGQQLGHSHEKYTSFNEHELLDNLNSRIGSVGYEYDSKNNENGNENSINDNNNINNNNNRNFKCESYLDRYFGLHSIKLYNLTIYFIVTKYIFVPKEDPSEKYDIKGSWIDRHTNHHVDRGKQMKDEDLHKRLLLESQMANKMYQQLYSDCEFLESQNIMDYSLLLGIYYVSMNNKYNKKKIIQRLSQISYNVDNIDDFENDSLLSNQTGVLPPS